MCSYVNDLQLGDFKDKFDCDWICTDMENDVFMEDLSKFKDNSFDLVFSCHAFEHCENPLKALREMKRVSKKFIFIITPHHCWHHVLGADNDHIFCFTRYQMTRLLFYIGLKYIVYTQELNLNPQFWSLISIGKKDE